jgi:hypothetical protein
VITLQTTLIFNGRGQTAIFHSPEDRLFHHMDKETEEQEFEYILDLTLI